MIEIKGFIETSLLDWDGKVSAVVFLPRCNFRCVFCHNYELVTHPEKFDTIPIERVKNFISTHSDFIDGIVITGGEPTIYDDLPAFIQQLKECGVASVKIDTNGTVPACLQMLIRNRLVDYIAMDIKAPLIADKYYKNAGVKVDLHKLRESIELILTSDIDYEFRTTVVPTLITATDIIEIAKQINRAKKYVLQSYRPEHAYNEKLRAVPQYSEHDMEQFVELAKAYVTNVKLRGI